MATVDTIDNPYALSGMVRDKDKFFGRTRELSAIYSRLRNMSSCNVHGPR